MCESRSVVEFKMTTGKKESNKEKAKTKGAAYYVCMRVCNIIFGQFSNKSKIALQVAVGCQQQHQHMNVPDDS